MILQEAPSARSTLMARKGPPIHIFPPAKTTPSTSSPSFSIASSPFRTFSYAMMAENIENAELMITKWDLKSSSVTRVTSLFLDNRREAKEFIKCVNGLRQAMHFLASQHSTSDKLVHAQNLMEAAIKRLEKEFSTILSANRNHLDPESVSSPSSNGSSNFDLGEYEAGSEEEFKRASDSITRSEKVTSVAMSDLQSIAGCMISSGYGSECIKTYKLIRKSIVDEGLYLIGIEKFRSSQIRKLNWEVLEHMIKNWLNAVKIAVKPMFHGEKAQCDHVFLDSQTVRELCFSAIVTEGARNLLQFPEFVAKCKKSPERIFPLMELYEVLSDLRPDIDTIFNVESTSVVKSQALSSIHALGDSVRSILLEFESTIRKDSSKTPSIGGGIHQLTEKMIHYISSLADYDKILSDIIGDTTPRGQMTLPESYFESPRSDNGSPQTVSTYLAWFIFALLCKLDSKAKIYRDVSLSYLFLANNLQYIVDQVSKTRLGVMLGQEWIIKHVKKVKQYSSSYEMIAWHKVFSSLPGKIPPGLSHDAAREGIQKFNAAFEEAYKKQITWVVPDRKLRDEVKISLARKLVPVYKQFYDNYVVICRGDAYPGLARILPEDLENYLSGLFHGVSHSDISSSSSSIRYSTVMHP